MRVNKKVLGLVLVLPLLTACATPGGAPSVLTEAEAAFNTAVLLYNGVCLVATGASFCTPADMQAAATLEQSVNDAFDAVQSALTVANGDVSAAAVQAALANATAAVNKFEAFVGQLNMKKTLKLTPHQ